MNVAMSAGCLALNSSFEPLTLVPLRRALRLVIDGKAEVVEADSERLVKSARSAYPRPLVIRLTRYIHVPRRFRRQVTNTFLFARDAYACQYCARTVGQLRTREVRVGDHEAPAASSVPMFMHRFAEVYKTTRMGELAVLAVAAAHHRLAWIHPFPDGNGRVARLHSHVLLQSMGLTNGVWSPLRGFARTQSEYYKRLAQADMPRHGDLDGRGNLSEKRLVEFIDYFLDVCIDQARFMATMLNMQTIRNRIKACLAFESSQPGSGIRMEAELALYMLFSSGPMERGEFKQITGLGLRTAESLLSALEKRGLVRSDTPKGKLIFGVPFHALRFYFPNLWPEAEAQA